MIYQSLKILNFRNLVFQELFFYDKCNIFVGDNAQGKTNILEALYLLSLTKSFKTNNINDLVNFDKDGFVLKASFIKNDYTYDLLFSYENKKKELLLNNKKIKTLKEIFGLLNIIIFIPDDLNLIKGMPGNRRKLIDIELSKIDNEYFDSLAKYYYLLKQRNIYLKNNNIESKILDVYDKQMLKYGHIIYQIRKKFISHLEPLVNKYYLKISCSDKLVNIKYQSNFMDDYELCEMLIINNRNKDLKTMQSNVGIHRDDFIFLLNNKEVRDYGSQGEQKSIILALKLALLEYIYLITKDYPIFLLDDVLAELDLKRQENLFKLLNNNIQTFITTTNLEGINKEVIKNSYIYKVENGNCERVDADEFGQ
ncbi:MAG: DNA replication/repair protein RecF [Bacilli bacterium]|jgi:DNA replication and repair protein RecF|nr:DNA replication/repair protein RecF [Bacilli bacterium]